MLQYGEASRTQDPIDLAPRGAVVGNVFEDVVADYDVEAAVWVWQRGDVVVAHRERRLEVGAHVVDRQRPQTSADALLGGDVQQSRISRDPPTEPEPQRTVTLERVAVHAHRARTTSVGSEPARTTAADRAPHLPARELRPPDRARDRHATIAPATGGDRVAALGPTHAR